jgi:hypothetical protein
MCHGYAKIHLQCETLVKSYRCVAVNRQRRVLQCSCAGCCVSVYEYYGRRNKVLGEKGRRVIHGLKTEN